MKCVRMRPPSHHEGGFSLIELLIGALVAVMALGAIVSVCIHLAKLRKVDEEINLAFIACTNSMEDIRGLPYSQIPGMNGVGFDVTALNGAAGGLTPLPGDLDGLPGQFTVTVDKVGGGTTLYLVVAEVEWVGNAGQQSFKLQTFVGERK